METKTNQLEETEEVKNPTPEPAKETKSKKKKRKASKKGKEKTNESKSEKHRQVKEDKVQTDVKFLKYPCLQIQIFKHYFGPLIISFLSYPYLAHCHITSQIKPTLIKECHVHN